MHSLQAFDDISGLVVGGGDGSSISVVGTGAGAFVKVGGF